MLSIKAFGYFSLKDLAAAATVLARYGLKLQSDLTRRDLYPILHGGWQNALDVDPAQIGNGPTISPQPDAEPLRLLFVHADDGSRMRQLKQFFSLDAERSITNIYNPHPGTLLADSPDVSHYFTDLEDAVDDARDADVILIVNSLYSSKEIDTARQIVHAAKPGTLVAIRGFSDDSYIATIAYQLAMNPSHYKLIHQWNSHHIDKLFKGYPEPVYILEEKTLVNNNGPTLFSLTPDHQDNFTNIKARHHHTKHDDPIPYPPVGSICQTLRNTAQNRFILANYLVEPLSEASADAVREQMKALTHIGLGKEVHHSGLSMDDYVYLFRLGDSNHPDAPIVFSDQISLQSIEA